MNYKENMEFNYVADWIDKARSKSIMAATKLEKLKEKHPDYESSITKAYEHINNAINELEAAMLNVENVIFEEKEK